MIVYNSSKNISAGKINKYYNHIGFSDNHLRSVKVKTPSRKKTHIVKKRKLTNKNITYLKSLGLKVKVN